MRQIIYGQVASRSGEMKGKGFSPRASRNEHSPVNTSLLPQWGPCLLVYQLVILVGFVVQSFSHV